MLRLVKWILLGGLAVVGLIVIFQNLTPIELRFLFSTIQLPQAAVLTAALLIGFVLGFSASTLRQVRSWRAKQSRDKQQPPAH